MTTREWFGRVLHADEEFAQLCARRQHYLDMATAAGQGELRRDHEPSKPTERAGLGLIDLEGDLAECEARYVALVREIEVVIAHIDKPRHRQVLTLRYLAGMGWQEIADLMGYADMRSAYKVHGWALLSAGKIISG